MSDDLINLARRAVASPHFRPMRGMVGIDGTVILSTSPLVETSEIVEWRDGGTVKRENRECTWAELRDGGWLPDLSDPATLGCLLALVREVWGQLARADITVGGWRIQGCCKDGNPRDTVRLCFNPKATEAAALVAALEAAPAPKVEQ